MWITVNRKLHMSICMCVGVHTYVCMCAKNSAKTTKIYTITCLSEHKFIKLKAAICCNFSRMYFHSWSFFWREGRAGADRLTNIFGHIPILQLRETNNLNPKDWRYCRFAEADLKMKFNILNIQFALRPHFKRNF